MTFLKNGGSAVDAVEMAIKVLEDREITNAGYGSNLAMDGNVECDATIVDHFGRSGAVGAVGRELFSPFPCIYVLGLALLIRSRDTQSNSPSPACLGAVYKTFVFTQSPP